ncbi:MAG: hypothetical protein LBC39_08760 [Methanobrevibacter sp.]|jgi:hypothetical protein|nr:hypothetical protein [Candidatus Methanovirga aequatorialis]
MKTLTKLCIFSWFFPGSGHMYYREVKKAFPFFAFTFYFNWLVGTNLHRVGSHVFLLLSLFFYIFVCTYCAYDVYKIGSKRKYYQYEM